MRLTLAVRRFDPAGKGRAFTERFAVDLPEAASVLDALLEAAEAHDPSLAFRRTCRSGICGTCGMTVNGRPALSCQVQVGEAAATGEIEVGPLPNFRVLRDLVVDMDPFFEGLRRALPWLVLNPTYDGRIAPARSEAMEGPATCVLCGICEADQPRAPGQAAGPASWVKAYRFALDPRDALGSTRLEVMADLGLVSPESVTRLARVCPKRILLRGALDPGGPAVLEEGEERRLAGEE
jgi:succinate dehydrogenase / fumarate reductase, iron-sulfur subunit